MSDEATGQEQEPAGGVPWARIVLGVVALAGVIWLGRQAGAYVPAFAEWVGAQGALGPVVFVLGYALAVVAFVPGLLVTLAGGAIFGVVQGTLYVFIAAVIGSTAAFLVARYVARSAIERRIAGDARFAAIDRAVGREGRKIVFLLRLSPVFPFNLLNYGLGLTKVSLGDYVIASLGMLPGTLAYVYLGKVAGDVAAVAGGATPEQGPAQIAVLVVGLIATFAVAILVARTARRALQEATEDATGTGADAAPLADA